ncbi:Deuterolysin metalloprotease family-domain-containing protein [Xylariomycetidae sp. FL0641]|nr:Deuterolysin metalloprotease family-domain-containing protein [Xylariomycetidae sp. FL0641]
MRFYAGISVLATLASAVSVDLSRRGSPLNVKLEMVGNTAVKASITNSGPSDLKVFKTGTFLDTSATEKVEVFQGDKKIAFDGIRLRVTTAGLSEEAFQTIASGETVEATFDIAETHDLSAGGPYDLVPVGHVSYAEANSTEIAGIVPISGSAARAQVDGSQAKHVRRSFHQKRINVQDDCTGEKLRASDTAIANCKTLSAAAEEAAMSGPEGKMNEYFKSSSDSTRSTVAGVFRKLVTECGSTSSGYSDLYCSDVYQSCSNGVLAYTLPSASFMVNCNLYFSALPALTTICHDQDQATTTLHEATHLTQIKGTEDYNTYGYNGVRSLSGARNLNHADTYALFANDIYILC